MSLYERMADAWETRREREIEFRDQCVELFAAFFRRFKQVTGAEMLRPIRIDDWTPQSEAQDTLEDAVSPCYSQLKTGGHYVSGYAVCMGLLLEGPQEEARRQTLAIHLKTRTSDPYKRSKVYLEVLGAGNPLDLPLVLPLSEEQPKGTASTASYAKPVTGKETVAPPGSLKVPGARELIQRANDLRRELRRLPPEKRLARFREWEELKAHFTRLELGAPPPPSASEDVLVRARLPTERKRGSTPPRTEAEDSQPIDENEMGQMIQGDTADMVELINGMLDPNKAQAQQQNLDALVYLTVRRLFRLLCTNERDSPDTVKRTWTVGQAPRHVPKEKASSPAKGTTTPPKTKPSPPAPAEPTTSTPEPLQEEHILESAPGYSFRTFSMPNRSD